MAPAATVTGHLDRLKSVERGGERVPAWRKAWNQKLPSPSETGGGRSPPASPLTTTTTPGSRTEPFCVETVPAIVPVWAPVLLGAQLSRAATW